MSVKEACCQSIAITGNPANPMPNSMITNMQSLCHKTLVYDM